MWTSESSNDILKEIWGSKEHSGRLRGQSKFVSPTTYYATANSNNDEFINLRSEWSVFQELILKSQSTSVQGPIVHDSGTKIPSHVEEDGVTNEQENVQLRMTVLML